MARFVLLNFRAGRICLAGGVLGLMAGFGMSLYAQSATNPAPMAGTMQTGPVMTPPPKPPPPSVPDTFNRYGKIWAPSDDAAHPIKLNVQFPGVGDMKIPSQAELNVRDKLEQLAKLSDADIRKQLEEWPPYNQMKLGDQGQLLQRIQAFKDLRAKIALQKAHDMGLLTLLPDQQARFQQEYWDKQLQMERNLAKQFEPIWRAQQQKMEGDLYREFSSPSAGPVALAPKPPQAPVPAAQNKPPGFGPINQTINASQPVSQTPH